MSTRRQVLIEGTAFYCHVQNDVVPSFADAFRLRVYNDHISFALVVASKQQAAEIIGVHESVVTPHGLRDLLHDAIASAGGLVSVDDVVDDSVDPAYDIQFLLSPGAENLNMKIVVRPRLRFLNSLVFIITLTRAQLDGAAAPAEVRLSHQIALQEEQLQRAVASQQKMQDVILKQLALISTYRARLDSIDGAGSSESVVEEALAPMKKPQPQAENPPHRPIHMQQSMFMQQTGVVTTMSNGKWKNVDIAGPFTSGQNRVSLMCQSTADFVGCYFGVLVCRPGDLLPDRSNLTGYVGSRIMRNTYSLSLETGQKEFWNDKAMPYLQKKIRTGDIVEMVVDVDAGSVSFLLNGEPCGTAFEGYGRRMYVAMLTVFYRYQRFQVLQEA